MKHEITLYGTNCLKCKILEHLLDANELSYIKESDAETIKSLELNNLPYLKMNDIIFDYRQSVRALAFK